MQLRRLEIFAERAEAEDRFLRDNLGRIAVPALVLGGQEDNGSPPANARIYAPSMQRATLTLYDGVSHFAMIEVPERSAADVRAFLEGRVR